LQVLTGSIFIRSSRSLAAQRVENGRSVDFENPNISYRQWVSDDVRFLMAKPGKPPLTDFSLSHNGTLNQWRRRA
jgi:hypothetical protein